ncbi:hypothetical protein QTJ16_007146 [Diplocarpon rosae]|uniref:Plethodontid modulating factor n=1 Tax=Diplocarpon rosae TaxID=946125 RepID=A0AAD9SUB8_9HELO|nr:hypothetical protein QTJ16_007146 [Diplocarpon rosae]
MRHSIIVVLAQALAAYAFPRHCTDGVFDLGTGGDQCIGENLNAYCCRENPTGPFQNPMQCKPVLNYLEEDTYPDCADGQGTAYCCY